MLEEIIFEFANQMGAYITYVLIQAMNKDNIRKLLVLEKKKNKDFEKQTKTKEDVENERHTRLITEEWIKNSISPNLIQILWKFNQTLMSIRYLHNNNGRKRG
jgi:hypothetical protein